METIRLTQVHRQGEASAVLKAANDLRLSCHGDLEKSTLDCLRPLRQISMAASMHVLFANWNNDLSTAITHTNAARHQISVALRAKLGFPKDDLHECEPILIKKTSKTSAFHKGDVLRFVRWAGDPDKITFHVIIEKERRKISRTIRRATLRDLDGREHTTILLLHALTDARSERQEIAAIEKTADDTITQGELAYVITAHAAQGSEWDQVVFFHDEMYMKAREDQFRHAYTCITRASKECYLVKLDRSAITRTSFDPVTLFDEFVVSAETLALFGKKKAA